MKTKKIVNNYFCSKYSTYYSTPPTQIKEILDEIKGGDMAGKSRPVKLLLDVLDKEDVIAQLSTWLKESKTNYRQAHLHYRQKMSSTCGISCYLMALSIYKNNIKPSYRNEVELFNRLRFKDKNYVKIESIIRDAMRKKMKIEIFSELDYSKTKFKDQFSEKLRREYLNLITKSEAAHKLKNFAGVKITQKILKKSLAEGKVILLNGTINSQPHMRLVGGYCENEKFVISDPQNPRKIELDFSDLMKISTPPLGIWAMSISR